VDMYFKYCKLSCEVFVYTLIVFCRLYILYVLTFKIILYHILGGSPNMANMLHKVLVLSIGKRQI